MIALLFRSLLYFQPFIWMFLLDFKNKYLDNYIYRFFFVFDSYLIFNICIIHYGISFEAIQTHHFISYSTFVLCSFVMLKNVYDNRVALNLSFLIVYLNSYYWEFMKHFNSILVGGIDLNFFIQMFRLFPLPFLLTRFSFDNHKKIKTLLVYGLVFSVINIICYNVIPIPIINLYHTNFWINYINRVVCLFILVKIFYEYGGLKNV